MPLDPRDPSFNPEALVTKEGHRIDHDVLGVVAEIQRRWPNLRIQYLDPDSTVDLVDAPYQVVEKDRAGVDRVIKQVWSLDSSLIDDLAMFDSFAGFDLQAHLDKADAKKRKVETDAWEERKGQMRELTTDLSKSTKDTWTFVDPETEKKVKTRQAGPHEVME